MVARHSTASRWLLVLCSLEVATMLTATFELRGLALQDAVTDGSTWAAVAVLTGAPAVMLAGRRRPGSAPPDA